MDFLGHTVTADGIRTSLDKINAVREWPAPATQKEVRSFVGLCSYYRRFVRGFAHIARPLHKLTEKSAPFDWTPECQQSFDELKEALTSAPILSYPVPELPFILDTDASDSGLGAVLSQTQEEKEKVIAYMSKALTKAERSYCTTRKELLAVVVSLKHFHTYVYGQHILLRTDNAAVSWMRNLRNPTGQVARWLQVLGMYNIDIQHWAGRKHSNADALSRSPCASCRH